MFVCTSACQSASFLSSLKVTADSFISNFRDSLKGGAKVTAQHVGHIGLEAAKQHPVPAFFVTLGLVGMLGEKVCDREYPVLSDDTSTQIGKINQELVHFVQHLFNDEQNLRDYNQKLKKFSDLYKESYIKTQKGALELKTKNKTLIKQVSDIDTAAAILNERIITKSGINREAKDTVIQELERQKDEISQKIKENEKKQSSLKKNYLHTQKTVTSSINDNIGWINTFELNKQKITESENKKRKQLLHVLDQQADYQKRESLANFYRPWIPTFTGIKTSATFGATTWLCMKVWKHFSPEIPNTAVTAVPLVTAGVAYGIPLLRDYFDRVDLNKSGGNENVKT